MEDTREEELAMEYTFDQVADLLDEMAETFPPVFFEQLNGGILLQEEAKPDPMFPEGEVYFMGEYVTWADILTYIMVLSWPPPAMRVGQRKPGGKSFTPRWPTSLPTTWNPWPTPTVWMTKMRKSCFVFWRNIGMLPDA